MKAITILLAALALGLLPATLGAQTNASEPINYYAEFADLMHGEMDARPAPDATPHTSRFPAFVHYREVMQGRAEDFPAYFEKMVAPSVPPAKAVFAKWTIGQECPHETKTVDCTAFTFLPVEDCSGR